MTNSAVDRYLSDTDALSVRRAMSPGGSLPMEEEMRAAEAMEALWDALTDAEREDVEAQLRSRPPAPEQLGLTEMARYDQPTGPLLVAA